MSLVIPNINSISDGNSFSIEVDVDISAALQTTEWSTGAPLTGTLTRWGRASQLRVTVGRITRLENLRLVDFDETSQYFSKIIPASQYVDFNVNLNGAMTFSYDMTPSTLPIGRLQHSGSLYLHDINGSFTSNTNSVTFYGTYINAYEGE